VAANLVRAWRLVRPTFADPADAFSGEGARRFGGRWNAPGRRVVYTSEHLSLAALETLAHADRRRFERDLVAFAVELPAELVALLADANLPEGWRARPDAPSARAVGDAWLAAGTHVALSVPSVLVPQERNLLLAPTHPRFDEVRIGPPTPFRFDERL
jgi:RES domain-containing protein